MHVSPAPSGVQPEVAHKVTTRRGAGAPDSQGRSRCLHRHRPILRSEASVIAKPEERYWAPYCPQSPPLVLGKG